MSLFSKITDKLASESGELKQIRVEAERRRSAKSSAALKAVQCQSVEETLSLLDERIAKTARETAPPGKPAPPKA